MRKYRLSEQTRQYCYEEEHGKQSVTLRQIVALIDFADVKAGSEGGWVDEECALSQQGECWIYDVNSVVFAGARIRDDARLTGFCVVSHEATIGGQACIHAAQISHHAQISDNVTVTQSQVRGYCRLADEARLLPHCQVIAARGLTADRDKVLQIYQRAIVSASRILHQRKSTAMPSLSMRLSNIGRKCLTRQDLKGTKKTTSGYAITPGYTGTRA